MPRQSPFSNAINGVGVHTSLLYGASIVQESQCLDVGTSTKLGPTRAGCPAVLDLKLTKLKIQETQSICTKPTGGRAQCSMAGGTGGQSGGSKS